MYSGLLLVRKEKKGKREEAIKGIFWRMPAIDRENRQRPGRVRAKTESEAAYSVMDKIQKYLPQELYTMKIDKEYIEGHCL
jgi:hypothetical protein